MRTDGDHRRHGPLRRLHRQPRLALMARLAPMRLGTGLPYAGAPPHGALAVTRGGWTAVGAARGATGLSLLPHRPLGRQLLGQRCHLGSHRVEHRQDRRLAWCKGRMHFFIGGHWKVHGMDHKLNDTDLATILQPKWLQWRHLIQRKPKEMGISLRQNQAFKLETRWVSLTFTVAVVIFQNKYATGISNVATGLIFDSY
jgi:hypothetical protein